jgi:predicted AlkP superfamily phosphohydrolase/phosphomutase
MSRTLVVGFDGAVLSLADRWMAEGRMPALAQVCRDGSAGPLRSVFPYNSAVAWTSLCTGASPGRHGIFDFVLPSRGQYRLRVAGREDRRVPALWNYASQAGARVGVINIPATFPAEPVNGVMVSGMDAPRLDDRAVHPAGYLARLRELAPDYRILSNAAAEAGRGDFEAAERELVEALRARSHFACALAKARDLDLLMINLEATDGAQHFFWQHFDPSHPRHDPAAATRWGDAIGRVYEATDREFGRLIEAYAPDTVFVVSDHGGVPTNDWVLFLNDWLVGEGFLRLRQRSGSSLTRRLYGELRARLPVPVRRRLRRLLGGAVDRARETALYGDVDWSRSRAYAQMQSGVRLNLAGREPSGIVSGADREAVLEELSARATALRVPGGAPVFAAVRRADQVYVGDAPGGWDVVLELNAGLHVRSRNTTPRSGYLLPLRETGMYLPSGVHGPVGMVAASGKGVEARGRVEECDIHQVASSVLAVMGVPAPDLDGRPFGFVTATAVSSGASLGDPAATGAGLDEQEEAEVLDRLRGLGYVD